MTHIWTLTLPSMYITITTANFSCKKIISEMHHLDKLCKICLIVGSIINRLSLGLISLVVFDFFHYHCFFTGSWLSMTHTVHVSSCRFCLSVHITVLSWVHCYIMMQLCMTKCLHLNTINVWLLFVFLTVSLFPGLPMLGYINLHLAHSHDLEWWHYLSS